MAKKTLYGGIEGGGTKFICAAGYNPEDIIAEDRFPTTNPPETLGRVITFFDPFIKTGQLTSIGLGSFGPVDLDPSSAAYGYITTTPKPNWSKTDILGILKRGLGVKIVMDMDVAASAMGEYTWGASHGIDPSLYLTIGTGIGGSYILNGIPLRGLVSLEMGHVRIPHDPLIDPFHGSCPFHGDCFEGLASGPSIQMRFNKPGEALTDDDPFWEIEAGYIAYALVNYILTYPPRKIVLGGGVMHRTYLFASIREKVSSLLNNYLDHPLLLHHLNDYIVPPALGYRSGVLGGIALAMQLDEQT